MRIFLIRLALEVLLAIANIDTPLEFETVITLSLEVFTEQI